jgi:hypothetical protein
MDCFKYLIVSNTIMVRHSHVVKKGKKGTKKTEAYISPKSRGRIKEGFRSVSEVEVDVVNRKGKEKRIPSMARINYLLPNSKGLKHNPKREFDIYSKLKKLNSSLPRGKKINIPATFRLILPGIDKKVSEKKASEVLTTKYDLLKKNEIAKLGVYEKEQINNSIKNMATTLHNNGFIVMRSAFSIAKINGKLVPILNRFDRVLTMKESKEIENR